MGMKEKAVEDIKRFIELSDNENWIKNAKELLTFWEERDKKLAEIENGKPQEQEQK
jgi:hypothetical protein